MIYSKEMAIVIVTCDSYVDVMMEYLRYFKLNWSDCPFELIIVTETLGINDNYVRTITAGKGTGWTKRAIIGIESTSCPYILLSMDDGFISEQVDNKEVFDILLFIKKHNIKYYRIPKKHYNYKKNPVFADRKNVYKIRKNEMYGVDFGHNIWRRKELLGLLGDGSKTAWQIEESLNEVAHNSDFGFYDDYVSDMNNCLHIVETVTRGKWMPNEIKKLNQLGIPVNLGKRDVLPWASMIKGKLHSFANKIVPSKGRKIVKKFFSFFGYRFVTKN